MDDWQLLESYGRDRSEDAFTEIVKRHLGLVYSAALRQVGDAELARDVAQQVFANLARRAKSLKAKGTLAGWLYRDTVFTARDLLRKERRRVAREQEAMHEPETSPDWSRIRPRLDAALSQLGESDRDAVLLRFFERRSLKEVGVSLGIEEDAARKRVSRALEKLRLLLGREGITTTSEALSGILTTHAVQAVPVGLAAGILAASLAAGSSAAAGTVTLIEIFGMTTKLKATIAGAAVLVAAGTPIALQHHENKDLRAQNEMLLAQTAQFAAVQEENRQLSNRVALMAANGLPEEHQRELNRLRGEVARLRSEAEQTQQLRAEITRLRSSGQGAPTVDPVSDALVAFLGEAVPPPADISPAHTPEGLENAVRQAAQRASVNVKKIEIDTSEFPFLVGLVCEDEAELRKVTSQFKEMPEYDYSGGTGSKGALVFSLVPHQSFPLEARERISRRKILRTQVFHNQLAAK